MGEKEFIEIKKNDMESEGIVIDSPVKGSFVKLEDIKDNDISAGILGQGYGVIPKEGIIRAPFNGEVLSLFPTQHAIGLGSDDGIQILIHVGVHTSVLEGKYFEALVKQGDKVRKGQQILRFDMDSLTSEDYDITTAVLITNHEKYENIKFVMT